MCDTVFVFDHAGESQIGVGSVKPLAVQPRCLMASVWVFDTAVVDRWASGVVGTPLKQVADISRW